MGCAQSCSSNQRPGTTLHGSAVTDFKHLLATHAVLYLRQLKQQKRFLAMKVGLDRLDASMGPDRSMETTDREGIRMLTEDLNHCRTILGFPQHVLSKYLTHLDHMHTAMYCMSQIGSFLQSLEHDVPMTSSQLRDGYQKAAYILKTAKEIGLVVPELGVIDNHLQQLSERAEMLLKLQAAMVDAEGSSLALVLHGLRRLSSQYSNFNPSEIAEAEQLLVVVGQEQTSIAKLLSAIEVSHSDLFQLDRSVVQSNSIGTSDDDLSSLVHASMASLNAQLGKLCRELQLQHSNFQSKSFKVDIM